MVAVMFNSWKRTTENTTFKHFKMAIKMKLAQTLVYHSILFTQGLFGSSFKKKKRITLMTKTNYVGPYYCKRPLFQNNEFL